MASKPNLRLATLIHPLYCEVVEINGKQKLRGLKIVTNLFGLFEKAGFNVSIVPVDEQTSGIADENGTYNGLYGAVQSGKADTPFVGVPLRLSESIGQFTHVILDSINLIMTKREPAQVFEGTLYDCLTPLGPISNVLLGVIVALILILLSTLVSKHASWNFFAELMTENFVHFRPVSLQLTLLVTLFIVRAVFGSAYSTDVTVANPPKLINSLEDLAESKLLPLWFDGDPVFLEFKQKVTKAHADVFNMGPKNRAKTVSPLQFQFQTDLSKFLETNSILYFEPLTSSICKYFCNKPFSRTSWTCVYAKNTPALTADKLKKYANKYLEQSLNGNTFKTWSNEIHEPSPRCESDVNQDFEAVSAENRVTTKLVPWLGMLCALIASLAFFLVEILLATMTFLFSVRQYLWM